MKLATHIRPLSHFKAHASKVVRQLGEEGAPMVITLNGEAKAVVQGPRL
jgi:PHD/YefM family antitoxin component YafN of YafNO toxin-antitoxin module